MPGSTVPGVTDALPPLQDDDVVIELGDGKLYYFSPGGPPPLPPDAERWTIPLAFDDEDEE
jgi:hypothetical protein